MRRIARPIARSCGSGSSPESDGGRYAGGEVSLETTAAAHFEPATLFREEPWSMYGRTGSSWVGASWRRRCRRTT